MSKTDQAGISEELFDHEDGRPLRLSEYAPEDYVVLAFFWLLAIDVFAQFFSRFVLGDSIGWTEEMARYLLIAVGFLGGAMAARKNTHIMMEFLYRYLPRSVGWVLSVAVDLFRIGFFAAMTVLTFKLAGRTGSFMVSIDVPKSVVYYIACAGFALMALRSVQLALRHWRQGHSRLTGTEARAGGGSRPGVPE